MHPKYMLGALNMKEEEEQYYHGTVNSRLAYKANYMNKHLSSSISDLLLPYTTGKQQTLPLKCVCE